MSPTAPTRPIAPPDRKLFAGPRLRRLRAQLGLTQSRMADDLGVSVSYLNLIERNQRPLTAQFLLRLADVFDLDLRSLTGDGDDQMLAEVAEVLADPLFGTLEVPRSELHDLIQNAPGAAQALVRLYGAWREQLTAAGADGSRTGHDGRPLPSEQRGPLEQVRDVIHERRNHFPELDEPAEALAEDIRLASDDLFSGIKERLRARHGIAVRVLPVDVLPEALRRYDQHRKQLQLSELLDAASRTFHAAYQLALIEFREPIDTLISTCGLADEPARRLLRINLANYFAAALMMPYGRFLAAAEQSGYDLILLGSRFGAGFEQVCHRLTTLQRPGARGVPFFMIRVDQAGNVSKRFAAGKFAFAKYGGTCPLWSLHATFREPGKILPQIIDLPDGARFFSMARTVRAHVTPWGEAEPQFAIALGCDLIHARHLVYARGLDLANPQSQPIGLNCALCPRETCRQRSQPPQGLSLMIDERSRGTNAFRFKGGQ
jgi:XRE family transcriptional regulator, fatty acid utilization regulator